MTHAVNCTLLCKSQNHNFSKNTKVKKTFTILVEALNCEPPEGLTSEPRFTSEYRSITTL